MLIQDETSSGETGNTNLIQLLSSLIRNKRRMTLVALAPSIQALVAHHQVGLVLSSSLIPSPQQESPDALLSHFAV